MITYILCADGACSGNPGPGGYAWELWENAVVEGNQVVAGSGSMADTTNNIMELSAALGAFEEFIERSLTPGTVLMRLDSQYVLKGIFEYMKNWKPKGWRTAAGKEVANVDIWKRIDAAVTELVNRGFVLKADWVKGHAGDIGNERVDQKACEMRDQAKLGNNTIGGEDVATIGTGTPQGLDLTALAAGEPQPAPAAASGDVTPEQVRLMRAIFARFEAGDATMKEVVADVRKNASALGC
jgi:ribonuclease HI